MLTKKQMKEESERPSSKARKLQNELMDKQIFNIKNAKEYVNKIFKTNETIDNCALANFINQLIHITPENERRNFVCNLIFTIILSYPQNLTGKEGIKILEEVKQQWKEEEF